MGRPKEAKHLPLYGIGPALCFPMAILSAVGIWLSSSGYIPGTIEKPAVKCILIIIGILLIVEGLALYFGADLNGNLQENIKSNHLKTNGSYRFVRNPCYCLFLLGCTGAICIAHNVILFILPFLFWAAMTIVLIHTEEKWLTELYGQEYTDYCKRVNRCIPWIPQKGGTIMLKTVLFIAIIGHLLCGICDCLLSYSPSGRLDLVGGLKDANKMREVFRDLPLSWPLASILLGVVAITMFGFGYLELSKWMAQFSETASVIMYISSVVFLIPIVVHHIICGLVEWLYIRLGRTDEARSVALEFQIKTIATMVIGYLGLVVYLVTLFAMVVSGRTCLPQWACIFNTLPLMILLAFTKLPAKGNIAGAIMYLGLFILL